MPITLDGDNGITTPTYGGSDTSEYIVPVTGFKNRIINGAMMIDQRNAGASVTNSAGGIYVLDRMRVYGQSASKFSIQQSTDTPANSPFVNSMLITSLASTTPASTDYYFVEQRIEGFNTADFRWGTANAATVTLSFWVKSSLTGTFGGALSNSDFNLSYPFSYTISSANTWEQKTITIAGPTSGTWETTNGLGIRCRFLDLGTGSAYIGTANSWQSADYYGTTGDVKLISTNGATFYITGVQLEKGDTATSFDYRPYGQELALCQRYYYRIGGGTGSSATATRSIIGYGFTSTTTNTSIGVPLPVTMRSTPTVNFGGTLTVSGSGYAGTPTDVTLNNGANTSCVDLAFTVATTTAALPRSATVRTDTDPDAFVDFSAEL